MKKRIYLSGPMAGMPNKNKEAFDKVSDVYKQLGYEIYNPHVLGNLVVTECKAFNENVTETLYMGNDIRYLSRCQAMILLPGWQNSKGCQVEIAFATLYNIPVFEAYTNKLMKFRSNINNVIEFKDNESFDDILEMYFDEKTV